MPLILTQNITNFIPSFDYDDIEGVQYQYPNGYKNMIKPGMKFIYYRGSFGSEGQRRIPEYFGTGMISERSMESAPDVPKSSRSWIAFIDEYKPFDKPIPFKENGDYLETNEAHRAYWVRSVRLISQAVFDHILELAEVETIDSGNENSKEVDNLEIVVPEGFSPLSETLIDPNKTSSTTGKGGQGRRSHYDAKWVGRLAEETVFEFLKTRAFANNVKWLERDGIRPGWDIEYTDRNGQIIRIEVKGTSLTKMGSCEITGNEWRAAEKHRSSYRLYIVTGVRRGKGPKISEVADPFALPLAHPDFLVPTRYRLTLAQN